MCTLDLPAKVIVMNMKQFNGQQGCTYSKVEGVPKRSTHLHRNWPYNPNNITRTHNGMLRNVQESVENKAPICFMHTHLLLDIYCVYTCTCIYTCMWRPAYMYMHIIGGKRPDSTQTFQWRRLPCCLCQHRMVDPDADTNVYSIYKEYVVGLPFRTVLRSNLSTGTVIGVMHRVFLGVLGKTLMNFWLGTTTSLCAIQYQTKG